MCVFFFLYVGMESSYASYLTVFVYEIGYSKVTGANLTALFWGAFTAARFASIFLAMKINPTLTMISSFALCVISAIGLMFYAEESLAALRAFTAILGVGAASIYATGYLWLEQRMKVTGRIAAAIQVSAGLGPDFVPIVAGQLVEAWPMAFMYVNAFAVFSGLVLFGIAMILARGFSAEDDLEDEDEGAKDEEIRKNPPTSITIETQANSSQDL